jgi:hypothetical protein
MSVLICSKNRKKRNFLMRGLRAEQEDSIQKYEIQHPHREKGSVYLYPAKMRQQIQSQPKGKAVASI